MNHEVLAVPLGFWSWTELGFIKKGTFTTLLLLGRITVNISWVDWDWPHSGCEEVEEIVGVGGEDDAVGAELGASGDLDTN